MHFSAMGDALKTVISNSLVNTLKPKPAPYDVRDSRTPGFLVRVYPSGKKSYVVQYGRGKRVTIGSTEIFKADAARDRAKIILGEVADGIDPAHKKRQKTAETWKDYLTNHYQPWVEVDRKDGEATMKRLTACFPEFEKLPLDQITTDKAEKWRTKRRSDGKSPATTNRDITALKAAISKAVEWGLLTDHPLKKLKPAKLDKGANQKTRFLSADEEQRLRDALENRSQEIVSKRLKWNEYRSRYGRPALPDLTNVRFGDYVEPIVLLAMNTGLRRGEIFSLQWSNVDLAGKEITIAGSTAKSGDTRHVPLNKEAAQVLTDWQNQTKGTGLVFYGREGDRLDNINKAWSGVLKAAEIENFRFHDLRHHFASKLVMAGVPLNTVRELLGHADLKMTLRYAHLAENHKAEAVELISA